jgi:hypothetical protein
MAVLAAGSACDGPLAVVPTADLLLRVEGFADDEGLALRLLGMWLSWDLGRMKSKLGNRARFESVTGSHFRTLRISFENARIVVARGLRWRKPREMYLAVSAFLQRALLNQDGEKADCRVCL